MVRRSPASPRRRCSRLFPGSGVRLVDGLAEAGVEAVAVQVALAGVVAADEAGLRIFGCRDSSSLRPEELMVCSYFQAPIVDAPWGR